MILYEAVGERKMTMQDITDFLDNKIKKNENEIVVTFYEIRIKNNLSEAQTDNFLALCKTRLENMGYQVFFTGAKFVFQNANRTVQPNQLMIAIKEEKEYK